MSRYAVTTQITRKSLPTLLTEWAEANGRRFETRMWIDHSPTDPRLGYYVDGQRLDRDTLMAIMETRAVPDLPPVDYDVVREQAHAEAVAAHRQYPQYEGYWDGWELAEVLEPITTKGGNRFQPGDLVLRKPRPAGYFYDGDHFTMCYSWRGRITTAVPTSSVMPAGACRTCRGHGFELRINLADRSGPMLEVPCPDCLVPAAAELQADAIETLIRLSHPCPTPADYASLPRDADGRLLPTE